MGHCDPLQDGLGSLLGLGGGVLYQSQDPSLAPLRKFSVPCVLNYLHSCLLPAMNLWASSNFKYSNAKELSVTCTFYLCFFKKTFQNLSCYLYLGRIFHINDFISRGGGRFGTGNVKGNGLVKRTLPRGPLCRDLRPHLHFPGEHLGG